MLNKKVRLELHVFINRDGICCHLEKMAEKGWLVEKIGGFMWIYRRISPQKLKFALYYSPTADSENAEALEKQNAFHEMCRHDGWEFACGNWVMQVFYNQRPDPVPLETEPALELDRIHTTAMCWLVPFWMIVLTGKVLTIWQNIQRYNKLVAMGLPQEMQRNYWDPSWVVSQSVQGFLILLSIVLYFRWYLRAKKAAREGVFLNPSKVFRPYIVLCLAALVWSLLRL